MPDGGNGFDHENTSPGFTSETSTTCRYDKATNKSTCTNKYKDSFKTETTTSPPHTKLETLTKQSQSASPAKAKRKKKKNPNTRKKIPHSWDAAGRPTAGQERR